MGANTIHVPIITYFLLQQAEQLAALKEHIHDEIAFHKKEIQEHQVKQNRLLEDICIAVTVANATKK